jgi:hypothetical protein
VRTSIPSLIGGIHPSCARAVDVVTEAYRHAGLVVAVSRQAGTFARLEASDPSTGQSSTVDLAADFRGHRPILMALGPVISETDAVAAKVAAVFSRAAARDYLDLAGILLSGRYDRERLIALAVTVDAGFNRPRFAEALAAVDRFPDEAFTLYGVDRDHVAALRRAMRDWSHELLQAAPAPERRPAHDPRRADERRHRSSPEEVGPGITGPDLEGPGIGF